MKKSILFPLLAILFLVGNTSLCQKVDILTTGTHSFRGLSVVNDNILWVSGNKGTVGKSTDAGKTWDFMIVPGFEKADFRDIEAFDENNAVIMGIAEPAYILRTKDGGKSWETVYENKTEGMFLDAMDFNAQGKGIAVGDPLEGHLFLTTSQDFGKTWKDLPLSLRPISTSGEACFASSGTNIRLLPNGNFILITGGGAAHFITENKKILLPILQGAQSTGANSIAFKNDKTMIVVGGDFQEKDNTQKNCVITYDGGNSWVAPEKGPSGYRSCVEFLEKNTWITCGLNGVDMSTDEGKNWNFISAQSFHVVRKAKNGNSVFFAGNKGTIGKLIL